LHGDKLFTSDVDNFKELHINIEDAHIALLADRGMDIACTGQEKEMPVLHFHSYYELFYIRNGCLEIQYEQNSIYLKKDSLLILSPRVMHRSIPKNAQTSRYCINFFVERNNLKTEQSLYDALTKILSGEYVYIEDASSVYENIEKLAGSIKNGNNFEVSLCFFECVLAIMRIFGYLRQGSPEELLSDSSLSRTYKIQRMISLYYMHDISLAFIAQRLHLSTRQLNRIVQSFYGCTYREIIARTRLKAAAELLRTNTMPVSEIAVKVGYHSLRGFYEAFKKRYGCLPGEYRRAGGTLAGDPSVSD